MPLFDFKCSKCEVVSEKLLRSSDLPGKCPVCFSELQEVDKLISVPARFIFKGKGFYATDYANIINKISQVSHKDI